MQVYRQLIKDTNWQKLQILVKEVINFDSKMCYMKMQEEIKQLKDGNSDEEEA